MLEWITTTSKVYIMMVARTSARHWPVYHRCSFVKCSGNLFALLHISIRIIMRFPWENKKKENRTKWPPYQIIKFHKNLTMKRTMECLCLSSSSYNTNTDADWIVVVNDLNVSLIINLLFFIFKELIWTPQDHVK